MIKIYFFIFLFFFYPDHGELLKTEGGLSGKAFVDQWLKSLEAALQISTPQTRGWLAPTAAVLQS